MPAINVVGLQWGDEGKGKIVDAISEDADMVVRYQGGNNAGHTIVIGDKTFSTHCLPSGVSREKRCLIASGVVLDPRQLVKEMNALDFDPDLGIDPRTHIIMPYHNVLDGAREAVRQKKTGNAIGTTGRGIGPSYEDVMNRSGIRFHELAKADKTLEKRIRENFRIKKKTLEKVYGLKMPLKEKDVIGMYMEFGKMLAPYLSDVSEEVMDAMDADKNVLFEGAQGTLLDIAHGNYPKVTSSHPMSGAIFTSVGMPPQKITTVGIAKAYITKVGSGPVVTCLDKGKWPVDESVSDPIANHIREKGNEYGTTTGRARRVGWPDLVVLAYTARMNGVDHIALTKLDVLSGLDEIKIATEYLNNGYNSSKYPAWDIEALEKSEAGYRKMEGFGEIRGRTRYEDLPPNARFYTKIIETVTGAPVSIISTGPERDETVYPKYGSLYKGFNGFEKKK